ncbi:hypothetical protein BGX34_008049 [Mortierella sp. NVP85]|nr:hypothetical protein BGX34_008049 [Mortierella sp. NVP85]
MSTKKTQDQKSSGNLSSIVSSLVRAAIGGKHHDVPDEDLDKYVAEMILKSADTAHQKYKTLGVEAYYAPDGSNSADSEDKAKLASGVVIHRSESNGLKTNKRFLSSIIKSTDDHNQALIRAEEKKAAEMAKELIADLDRRAAERSKRGFYGKEARRDGKSSLGRMRMDEIERSRSRSTSGERRSRSRSSSPVSLAKDGVMMRGRGTKKYDAAVSSSSTGSRLGSKMDKYFEEGYDPMLDTHSDDEATNKLKRKKSGKDHKHKESKDRHRKKHKKHKSERSAKSSRHHDSSSEDDEEKESSKHRRTEHHSSESRRRRHHGDSTDDEKSKSRSSKSRRKSRSPSPERSRRHKDSSKSERDREERGHRAGRSSDRKRTRDSNSSGDERSSTAVRSKGRRSGSMSRSRSRTPPPSIASAPVQSKPSSREWDLHKVNKEGVRANLLNINRKPPS